MVYYLSSQKLSMDPFSSDNLKFMIGVPVVLTLVVFLLALLVKKEGWFYSVDADNNGKLKLKKKNIFLFTLAVLAVSVLLTFLFLRYCM